MVGPQRDAVDALAAATGSLRTSGPGATSERMATPGLVL